MPTRLGNDELWAKSAYAEALGVNGGDPSITVTPASGEYAHVDWVAVSWSDGPNAADKLTVSIGGTERFTWLPGVVTSVQGTQFIGPFVGETDEAIVVALTVAGAIIESALSIKYRKNATVVVVP